MLNEQQFQDLQRFVELFNFDRGQILIGPQKRNFFNSLREVLNHLKLGYFAQSAEPQHGKVNDDKELIIFIIGHSQTTKLLKILSKIYDLPENQVKLKFKSCKEDDKTTWP
jgi:hypothetical protein